MKKTQVVSAGIAFVLAITFSLHAQNKAITVQSAQEDSIVSAAADAQGLQLVPSDQVPLCGTFWTVLPGPGGGVIPPFPCPPLDPSLPIYAIADGQFLVDGTIGSQATLNTPQAGRLAASSTSAAGLEAQADAVLNLIMQVQTAAANQQMRTMARAMGMDVPSPGDGSDYPSSFVAYMFDTNQLWLEITNVANGQAYLNLHNATNQVYAIWCTTNLLANWNVETEVRPTDTNCMPCTVPTLERQSLFLRAQDWTGVTENGNMTPIWWFWKFYHTINLSDTSLDSTGDNTLLYDYENGIDPNIIAFTLSATNLYVNQITVPLQINLHSGAPSYIAVLVNDTNYADANWQAYTGTNITVNLGSTDGVYIVWLGLRGLPADAQQTWDTGDILFTLDRVPPTIVVTNPVNAANAMTARPYLQLQGYGNEPLSIISFDLANVAGIFTNQPGFVTDQVFDTNRFDFTTNFFQCYDIPLTNGLNTITLRAVDRAGNLTTTNVAITLDYSLATNPPVINVIWPQDGMQISGASFTLRGLLNDETATVAAQIVDANGNTNVVAGLVERGGIFWVENLPLTNGDNAVTVTATDAAGNVTTTNLTVSESDVSLTIDYTPSGDGLYQPSGTVGGSISDPSYAIWVNGVEASSDYWYDDWNEVWCWQADNVPVYGKGTATFDAVAYPADTENNSQARSLRAMNNSSSSTPSANASSAVEMGAYVAIVYHDCNKHRSYSDTNGITYKSSWTKIFTAEYQPDGMGQWVPSSSYGGTVTDYGLGCNPDGCDWRIYSYAWTHTDRSVHCTDSTGLDANYPSFDDPWGIVTGLPDEDVSELGQAGYPDGYPPSFIYHYYANGVNCHQERNGGTVDATVSAHTAVKLYTGGKAQIGRQNLFCINCWADRYDQPPDDNLSYDAPWLGTTATSLDPTSLQVLGKTPGSDGNVWIVLPDNTEQDMTVTAPAKHYDAGAGAQKYIPYITANGANLDNETPEFCVGQQVTFILNGLPEFVDAVGKWNLPGNFVNKLFHYSATCTTYRRNDDLLAISGHENLTTSCWYVNKPGGTVGVNANLHFSNGQYVSVAAMGSFTIYRPQVNSVVPNGPFGAGLSEGMLSLENGPMDFTVSINSKYSGNFGLTQLVNYYAETIVFPPDVLPLPPWTTYGNFWLDGSEYYVSNDKDQPCRLLDEPGVHLILFIGSYNGNWQDYVRFTPDGGIPITLGRINWDWSATCVNLDPLIGWYITSDGVDGPTLHDDDSFPLWSHVKPAPPEDQ